VTSAAPECGLRERKKAQTRAAFIDAGLELFGERGYDAVTVDDVCDVVDVSSRTFFRYFGAKADLILAELDRLLAGLLDDLRERPDSEAAWSALRHALLAVCDAVVARKRQYLAVYSVIRATPELVATNAASLLEWERQMSAEVTRRLPSVEPPRARLMTGVALTVFRVCVDEWAGRDGAGDLAGDVRENLALMQPAARGLARSDQ
jgi:AcrR family transcriptional regulator